MYLKLISVIFRHIDIIQWVTKWHHTVLREFNQLSAVTLYNIYYSVCPVIKAGDNQKKKKE